MSDRDELAALIYQHFGTPDGDIDALNAADAILARWRLVPVEHPRHDFMGDEGTECPCWSEGYSKGADDGDDNAHWSAWSR